MTTSDTNPTETQPSRPLLMAALLAAFIAPACGGVTNNDNVSPDAGEPSADAGEQTQGPTVMVSPSDGQRGVLKDTPLILTFSEPMDTASVEAAWTSTSLPKESMAFSWNSANTILTVDASEVVDYPAGGIDVDRYDYDLVVDTSARSAAGVALDNRFTSSFASARAVTMQLVRVDAGTGGHNGSAYGTDIRVGDTASNGTWRGFITIDLATLPAVVQLTDASLFVRQTDVVGHPYVDLGNIRLLHLDPITDAIDFNDFSGSAAALGVFSDSDAQANPGGDRSLDVKSAVEADLAAGATVSSYRLEFDVAQEGNDIDHAIFDRTSVRLDVRVLAE